MNKSQYHLGESDEGESPPETESPLKSPPQEILPVQVKDVLPIRKLHREEAGVRLQMLGKTTDGDRYAYLKIVCTDMKLTDISVIASFENLLYVNVSNNLLTLEALQALTTMPFVVLIHADHNQIESVALKRMKYLQVVIMNYNQITSCRDFYQPQACTLELGYNQISKIEFDKDMPELKYLDLRNNLIKEISGLKFAKLQGLYLAGNKINSLVGLELLINLSILHVRNNPIKKLDGFSADLKKLAYINLRNCKIGSLQQVKKMKVLPGLRVLILKGTPYMGGSGEDDPSADEDDDPELRVEILAAAPNLQRINKTPVTEEEREEATELLKTWIEEGEDIAEEEEEEEVQEEDNVEEPDE